MKTRTLHRALSMLLTAAMVMNIGLTPVFAAEGVTPPGVSGVCTHHAEHTEDCGYRQGTPCGHAHTEDCYKVELTCPITTGDTAGDAPEVATDSNAVVDSGNGSAGVPHTHSEDCYTKTDNCKHEHNEACGYTPDSPCTYDTASCTECDTSDKPAEKVCTCPPVDSGELVHGKDCPLYTAPALSEAVQALIAMVDALPNVADITEDNKEATLPAFEAAAEAYGALSGDDKAAFEATEQYKKLMALHGVLYAAAPMANVDEWDISKGDLNLSNSCGGTCAGHTVTGETTTYKIIVSSGTHNVTLDGVTIDVNGTESACAFEIKGGATVNLTLTGTNVLKSGMYRAGLEVIAGNTLTITSASTGGTVTGTGGAGGAGIGGGFGDLGGTITISGGTVTGTGGNGGAGIGGGQTGAGGTITISGGTVTGTGGHSGAGIGGGDKGGGGNIAISGHAVVFATKGTSAPSHIGGGKNGASGTVNRNGGIVFEGDSGAVYGSVTLGQDLTIAPEKTLTINSGSVLEVASGVTLTNNGTIDNLGTIISKGTLSGNGSLTGDGVVQTTLTESMISLDKDIYVYTGSAIQPTVVVSPVTYWGKAFNFVEGTDYTVTAGSDNTVVGAAAKVTVSPQGSKLTGSMVSKTFTITQSDTAFTGGIKTYKGTNEQSTFIYGDTITVKVTVAATGTAPAPRSRAVPTANQMALFQGTVQLTDPQTVISGTELTFTIATTDKQLAIGENAITAKYVESTNMAGHEQTITVTLNKKPLTSGTITAGRSKPYDGNNSFSGIAATFSASDGVLGSDAVTATVGGTTSSSAVGTSLPLTVTSATLGAADAGFYLPPTDLTTFTGNNVAITKIDPTITVTTDKSSHMTGKEITVTVKITNPVGATSGFPEAGEIAIAPTNAILKTALAQQGLTGVYTATYILGAYSPGAKAKFVATVPNETTNYNANTTGGAAEVEILDKYTPTVVLEASETNITYGESVTLTVTVGKNGQTSPLAGTVQFSVLNDPDYIALADPVTISSDGKAIITVGKEILTRAIWAARTFQAEFIPESGSDYKSIYRQVTVSVNQANLNGVVTIGGTPKYGETLTANTDELSGLEGDTLEFAYQWIDGRSVVGYDKTYTIKEDDIGKEIYVVAISKNINYANKSSEIVTPTKADSTLTITDNLSKTYDGTAVSNPTVNTTGSTGAVTFEWYSGDVKLDSAPKNAGSYTVKAILAQNATHVGVTATRDFVISKAALAITGYTAENKNYDGKRDATVSAVAFSGLQNGESLTSGTDYTTVASFADQNANSGISVTGTVTLTTTATASNYSLTSNTLSGQTANIAAINPTYSVANQKITLNKTLAAIQASGAATGVNGESVAGTLTWAETSGGAALADDYSFTGNADDTKTLYWTFAPTSGNYKTLSGSTVFTLTNKKVPVLTVSNIVETYNGKAITTVNGTAKEDGTTVAGTFAFDGAPTMKDADVYNVTVKFAPNDTESYEIATTSITVTINKATVGIALNLSKDRITAGEPLPTPSIAYSGLVSGESLIPATEPIFAGMPSGSTEGTYTITWSNKAAMQAEIEALSAYQNYTANYKDSVTLTIEKKSGGGTGGGSTGGGGGSTGGSDNPTPPSENKPDMKPPVTEGTNAKINSDKDGNATAKADDKEIAKAIEKAQKADKGNGIAITLNVKTMDDTKSLSVTLSAATMTALTNAKVAQFTINNGLTTITLDLTALNALKGGDVILSVSKVDVKTLSAEAQNAIGNRPVFRFGATVGGKAVTDFGGGRVGLQMPYTRSTTEQAGNLCAVYVDGNGKLTWLENSSYESITGMMLASTSHFSIYGVGYKQSTPKFTDVGTHWARNDIDFVVARGLLTGTSNTTFAPDQSMTRGMFVTALGRLAGVDTKQYNSTKFTDVKADAYYAPYVAWASANNIVTGTSDTTFSPDKAITRQEMAVMLVNYSKAIGYKLPSVHTEVTFTDASSIASWAKDAVKQMQMAGILMGKSGNRFDSTATATRAEVSAMLRRFVELVVNTETAEGWAMNESGQWMYIENGKRTTGKKTIDGTKYTFDQFGVTTALPPERKYLTHIVQKGESFWSIARKYKVSMFELAKVNGKTIFSVIRSNEELRIPQ